MPIAFVNSSSNTAILSATSGSVSVAMPTGTVDKHVMIANFASRGSSPTMTAPAGWVQVLGTNNGTTHRQVTFYKVCSGETGPYSFSITGGPAGTYGMSCSICTLSGVDNTTPVDNQAGQANASSTTVAIPAVTLTNTNDGNSINLSWVTSLTTDTVTAEPTGVTNRVTAVANTATTTEVNQGDGLFTVSGSQAAQSATISAGHSNIGQVIGLNPQATVLQGSGFRGEDQTGKGVPSLGNTLPGGGYVSDDRYGNGTISFSYTLPGAGFRGEDQTGKGTIAIGNTLQGAGFRGEDQTGNGTISVSQPVVLTGAGYRTDDRYGNGTITVTPNIVLIGAGYWTDDQTAAGRMNIFQIPVVTPTLGTMIAAVNNDPQVTMVAGIGHDPAVTMTAAVNLDAATTMVAGIIADSTVAGVSN